MSCWHYYIHSYSLFSFVSKNCVWYICIKSICLGAKLLTLPVQWSLLLSANICHSRIWYFSRHQQQNHDPFIFIVGKSYWICLKFSTFNWSNSSWSKEHFIWKFFITSYTVSIRVTFTPVLWINCNQPKYLRPNQWNLNSTQIVIRSPDLRKSPHKEFRMSRSMYRIASEQFLIQQPDVYL